MNDSGSFGPDANLGALRSAIQAEYEAVALTPQRGFHFHTGRRLASLLGYREAWLEGIADTAIASFAGTGNPFAVGEVRLGERVVDAVPAWTV